MDTRESSTAVNTAFLVREVEEQREDSHTRKYLLLPLLLLLHGRSHEAGKRKSVIVRRGKDNGACSVGLATQQQADV